ncbi:reductase [Streptomyces solincola]|uniref:Reductase n=1 Tax=Streptomyces solincola TaxID=2100817 RepID=A0A2S9PR11_9ACTN|nr:flavin reductase family protein [Streptomyces solincola]PRH76842.1 reductase [Streptomyces solincola]
MRAPGAPVSVSGVLPTTTTSPQSPTADRRAPHGGGVPHADGVSDEEFRAAMSRLTGGVVLVTAHDPDHGPRGEDVGMTATAFLSVSLDPPLVLVSLRAGSRMDDLLAEQPLWGVSVLSEAQRQVAGRFAMKGRLSDKLLFADVPHTRGEASGAPLLGGSLATLECRTHERVEAGDHTLVIGRVLATALPAPDAPPLTYFRGRYRHLA